MKRQITLLGITLTVGTDSADPLYILDVARHVEDTAKRLAVKCPSNTARDTLAVMTALEIADELYRKAGDALPETRRPRARIEQMVRKIDAELR